MCVCVCECVSVNVCVCVWVCICKCVRVSECVWREGWALHPIVLTVWYMWNNANKINRLKISSAILYYCTHTQTASCKTVPWTKIKPLLNITLSKYSWEARKTNKKPCMVHNQIVSQMTQTFQTSHTCTRNHITSSDPHNTHYFCR